MYAWCLSGYILNSMYMCIASDDVQKRGELCWQGRKRCGSKFKNLVLKSEEHPFVWELSALRDKCSASCCCCSHFVCSEISPSIAMRAREVTVTTTRFTVGMRMICATSIVWEDTAAHTPTYIVQNIAMWIANHTDLAWRRHFIFPTIPKPLWSTALIMLPAKTNTLRLGQKQPSMFIVKISYRA